MSKEPSEYKNPANQLLLKIGLVSKGIGSIVELFLRFFVIILLLIQFINLLNLIILGVRK